MAAVQAWYQALLVVSILVSAGTTAYVWSNRDGRGAVPLVAVFASATLWGVTALVETRWQTASVSWFVGKVILVAVVLQVVGF